MNPLVSVVVATYRREDSLMDALMSLATQSYRNLEIVLVDDNDDLQWNKKVCAIKDVFLEKNEEIAVKYIENHPNQGSALTRNIGIAAAAGEYVTFLDDDDIYLPNKVSKQVMFMETGEYDYSITDLHLYNEDGVLIDKRIRSYIKDTSFSSLMLYHLKYHMTGTDTMMFRKTYLTKIGGFAPINVGDEFYLMQRAIEGDGKFGYLPGCEIKAYVHTGEGGLSSGDGKIQGENALYEHKKAFFNQLASKDVRYIRMRHYAVLAYANWRNKKYWMFFLNGFFSFLCAPANCTLLFTSKK